MTLAEEQKAKRAVRDKRYYEKHKARIVAKETAKKKLVDKTPQGKTKKAQQAKRYRERHPTRVSVQVANSHKKNPSRRRMAAKRHRVRKRNVFIEDVDMNVLFVRDCGTCQLCGNPVSERTGRMRPSEDHIIPIARGGTHCYANVQLAHLSCNSAKGGRLPK